MDHNKVKRIQLLTKLVVVHIVEKRFSDLDLMTGGKDIPAMNSWEWLEEDDEKPILCLPPLEAFEDVEYTSSDGKRWSPKATFPKEWPEHSLFIMEISERRWKVEFGMWIQPKCRSDYILELIIVEDEAGNLTPIFRGLHIM